MASTIQIVPKFQHPHVESYIYDNTRYEDIPDTEVDDSIKYIAVFRSDKGIDNTFVKMTNQKQFVDTYGKTNYQKFGQPLMMPYAELGSGDASVNCMRIMPDDATRANSCLLVYYRTATRTVGAEGEEPGTVEPVFQVIFRQVSFSPELDATTGRFAKETNGDIKNPGCTTNEQIEELLEKAVKDAPAKDGGKAWKCLPLMYFSSVGRGDYGNKMKWRIINNYEYEKDYEQNMYSFEILNTEEGVSKIATYVGGLVTAQVSNSSTFINDVINDYNIGSYPVNVYAFEENVEFIYNEYTEFLEGLASNEENPVEVEIPELKEFNLLFGKYVASENAYEYFQVVSPEDAVYPLASDDEGAVLLDEAMGNTLSGGFNGAFATFKNDAGKPVDGGKELLTEVEITKANSAGITSLKLNESTQEELYFVKAFTGLLDKLILASRRIPADVLFDANYPYNAKVALAQLALLRDDCVCFIDTGVDYTSFSTSTLRTLENKYMDVFQNRLISKNVQWYEVREPFTFKKVKVTPTYWLAQNICTMFKENGREVPIANARARLTDFVRHSMKPSVELYETDLKERLNNDRFNYWEAIDENTYQRSVQNTAQEYNSDLLEESNMHVLMWLKRNIENDCLNNLYNFANAAERQAFTTVETAKYEGMIGKELYSLSIRFDMNEWEAERSIIHCYVELQFRTINKRAIVEIDVNKRDFTA